MDAAGGGVRVHEATAGSSVLPPDVPLFHGATTRRASRQPIATLKVWFYSKRPQDFGVGELTGWRGGGVNEVAGWRGGEWVRGVERRGSELTRWRGE